MLNYNPLNWYWIVGGDETKVFSSKSGSFVQSDNSTYMEWVNEGGTPTHVVSKAELGEVLAPYQIRPIDIDVLDGYQDAHSRKITIEVIAKVLFALTNEVRALKGQPTINAAQFRNYVKGLM